MSVITPPRDPDSLPNAEFVEDLQNGLTLLWDGTGERPSPMNGRCEEYICHTLHSNLLRQIIDHRLRGGYYTYRTWCEARLIRHEMPSVEIQAGRKAWMLDLIEEFS